MAQYIFARNEEKYLISASVYAEFKKKAEHFLSPDGEYPVYSLWNLYYDSPTCELARRSVEKPVFKEKLRIRSYGPATLQSVVYVETKTKYKGTVYKRRVGMSYETATRFLSGDRIKPQKDGQIVRELNYFSSLYQTEPKAVIIYDRIAYKGRDDPDLRLTFDENIRYRTKKLTLFDESGCERLLSDGTRIMEIKADKVMPRELIELLNIYQIHPGSFSKYGEIYRTHFQEMERKSSCLTN